VTKADPADPPPEDQARHWGERLRSLGAEFRVPGATLGIWAEGRETLVCHGVANARTKVPTTVDTLFQIGSITKVWTATMIMQLVEEGRLSLDTPVSALLPTVRLGTDDVGAEVTVRHLLTHTSGVDGDIFTDTGRGSDCVEIYVDRLGEAATIHPVGAAYSYCNSGFVLLGRIIEVLDGCGWDASLRRRLIEPLGLTSTVTLPEEAILHRAAVGHREPPHHEDPVSVWALPRSLGPAGLITSTAHDVLGFARLHLDQGVTPDGRRLLSTDSVLAMQQPQFDIPGLTESPQQIGLAWRMQRWGGHRIVGHDGGTVGQLAYLRIDLDSQVAAVLLTNGSASSAMFQPLFAEIFDAYAGVMPPPDPEPASQPLPQLDLSRHVGRYERESRRFDVSLHDGQIQVVSTLTGTLAAIDDEGPHQLTLHPVDATGDYFVARMRDESPWLGFIFDRLADGTPYLYFSGRTTRRVD
jgi:CubicO group peptidase (beta-lactamase class C family)